MKDFTSISAAEVSQAELHKTLLSAVAPRPIALASTIDTKGQVNLSPFSFFNVFSSNPPILIFSPARRGRDNTTKHTYQNVKEVKEVVIHIVNHAIVEQMSLSSTEYAKGVNEFDKAGFTALKSDTIRPPRIAEAPVAIECTVDKVIELGDGPGAGNLVVSRVQKIHIRNEYLTNDELDTKKLDLVARLGGSWYSRVTPESLFEIPKPLQTMGIGIDQLPNNIRTSTIFTGNNLARMANVEQLPSQEEVEKIKSNKEVAAILEGTDSEKRQKTLHVLAQQKLQDNQTNLALKIALLAE